ncbi:murein biosynthesis integral membrane protein MurJ [Neobacillus sp. PS2-9]|uniref:murein biosynthesis integral membrane protein MurJ n=1 Tax=Neobacillus sp. PS2-9 TaxID=3070676 RepID=UPI0027E20DED|nr:murein biosynthesis integral membrane protein MurJ [Neobacillus sp. PS2-9]WML58627.1 murein biosynthesis integral membrane protein MurJ [Neobacillus sp. PS2-9]
MNLKKSQSILKATVLVSIIVIASKILGFIREAIIASYYGANSETDAFFVAQSMPAMVFPAVCSSFSTAFISLYINKTINNSKRESDQFASKAMVASLGISISLSILAVIIAPDIVPLLVPGFNNDTLSLAIFLTRLVMAAFFLTMVQYMLSAILNSRKLFYASQVSGLLSNILIILITIGLGRNQGIELLTITFLIGNLIQVLVLMYWTKKNQFSLTLKINPFDKDVKNIFVLALPILLGNSIIQLNNIVDKALASKLSEGAVSALSYSGSINSMIISIFITSLSTVLYPTLAEDFSKGKVESFSKSLVNSLLVLTMILLPLSLIVMRNSSNIVTVVFGRGSFNAAAISLTSSALTYYSLSYVFYAIREVIIRGFYAIQDTKTPMLNGALGVFLNIIFSLMFVKYLGISGIALGTTISAIVSAILMLVSLKKKIPSIRTTSLLPSLLKFIFASMGMLLAMTIFSKYFIISNTFVSLVLVSIFGLLTYIIILILLKCEQITFFIKKLKLRA